MRNGMVLHARMPDPRFIYQGGHHVSVNLELISALSICRMQAHPKKYDISLHSKLCLFAESRLQREKLGGAGKIVPLKQMENHDESQGIMALG